MMTKRWFIKGYGMLALCVMGAHNGFTKINKSLSHLKTGYAHLKVILALIKLSYINIEFPQTYISLMQFSETLSNNHT